MVIHELSTLFWFGCSISGWKPWCKISKHAGANMQWRYYGPVCARRSVNGLFRQNGSVFGPVLPQKSTFSGTNVLVWYIIRIVRARVIYLSTENNFNKLESMFDFNFSHEKHILSLAMVTDRQTKHKHKYVSQQIAMSDLQIDFI